MIKKWISKGIVVLLTISMVGGVCAPLAVPQAAQAQWAVFDAGNTVQNTITATGSSIQTGLQSALNIKTFSLDAIAYAIAKQILRQIVADTVNWINSGFDGNPAFISDPAGFFLNIGDELLGKFLESNELTNFLCSPFSIDVRISIAFRYRPFAKRVPTCTLSKVIRNSQGAIKGANINGFTAGDFRQGGWPAFVSLTTEPQNNQYGAFIEADNELSIRIGNKTLLKHNDLLQGKGFLSWEKCTEVPLPGNANYVGPVTPDVATDANGSAEAQYMAALNGTGPAYNSAPTTEKRCETQTPGSVIAGQLENSLASPLHELELASQINQIVNALFAQLIKQVLVGGLRSVSGAGPSDPDSYINKLQQDQTLNNQQLQTIKQGVFQTIDRYIQQATQFRTTKQTSLDYTLQTKQQLDAVKTCFNTKLITTTVPPLTQTQVSYAQSKIGQADALISTSVASTSAGLLREVTAADANITQLNTIKSTITSATTINDVAGPSNQYLTLVNSGALPDAAALVSAQTQINDIRAAMDPIRLTATRLQQACTLFPSVLTY